MPNEKFITLSNLKSFLSKLREKELPQANVKAVGGEITKIVAPYFTYNEAEEKYEISGVAEIEKPSLVPAEPGQGASCVYWTDELVTPRTLAEVDGLADALPGCWPFSDFAKSFDASAFRCECFERLAGADIDAKWTEIDAEIDGYDAGDANAQKFSYFVLGGYICDNDIYEFDLADLKAYANNEIDINSVHIIVWVSLDNGDDTYTELDLIFTVNDFLACLPAEEVEEALNYWREELEWAIDYFGFEIGAEALSELSIIRSVNADRLESIKIGDKVFEVGGGDAIEDVDRLPGSGDASKLYRLRTTETEEREEAAKSVRLFLRNVRHMTEQEWQDYLQGLRDGGEIGEENVDWFGFISDDEVDGEGRIDYYLYASFEAIMRSVNGNIQVSTEMIEPDGSGSVMDGFWQAVQELGVGDTSDADWSGGQFSRYKVCICPDSCTFDICDEYRELAHTTYEDIPRLIERSNVVILCAREREQQDVVGEYLYDVYDCTLSDFIAIMYGEEPQNEPAEEIPVNMIETFDMDGVEDWAAEVQDSGQTPEGLLIETTPEEAAPEVIESYALYAHNGSGWERIVTEQTPIPELDIRRLLRSCYSITIIDKRRGHEETIENAIWSNESKTLDLWDHIGSVSDWHGWLNVLRVDGASMDSSDPHNFTISNPTEDVIVYVEFEEATM